MARKIDAYVKNQLDLEPLDLPEEDLIDETKVDPIVALAEAFTIHLSFPDSRFGPGKVAISVLPKHKKALFMAASHQMFKKGLKKTQVLDEGKKMYSHCWGMPTTAGVLGCVAETFIGWCLT